ncbi:phage portal protein [Mycobacteroides abscessus]|nr:phage portal protein [Mycobacteroides abscessus]
MTDALAPHDWFMLLNAKFTAVMRPPWSDKRLRPTADMCGGVQRYSRPRNQVLDTLWSYRTGDPPLPLVAEEYQDCFRDVLRKARSNYAPMCVNAMLDRMELQAVSTTADSDTNGDDFAAQVMEESGFLAVFKELLDYVFSMAEGYGMVVPGTPVPTIHAIDPRRCIGLPDLQNPVRLRAALVREWDPILETHRSYLFLPGKKWTFALEGTQWNPVSTEPELIEGLDELGGIPIVRFDNALELGEYEPHIDLLDRINDVTLQRIIGFWYQALRQRALVGDEDEDDEDEPGSEPVDFNKLFKAGPGSLWRIPKDFEIWESQQADFSGITNAKRDDVKEFAAVTSTPLHLITPDAANGSAEGAGLIRESATSKVRDRRARITPRVKLLWRIVFALAKQDRGPALRLHWGPIEFRTLAEKASASAQSVGTLSLEQRCERIWEMSPEEAEENITQLAAEQILLPNAPTTPTTQSTPTAPATAVTTDVGAG